MLVKLGIFPKVRGENQKYLKPPPSPQRILLVWNGFAKSRAVPFPRQCSARPTLIRSRDGEHGNRQRQDIAGCSATCFILSNYAKFPCISNLEHLKHGESSLYNSHTSKRGPEGTAQKNLFELGQKVAVGTRRNRYQSDSQNVFPQQTL